LTSLQSKHFEALVGSHLEQFTLEQLTHLFTLRLAPRGQLVQVCADEHDVSGSQAPLFSLYPPKQVRHWYAALQVSHGKGQA